MISVRPKIAELVYQLYGRSLHPELFDIYQTRRIERGGYKAVVHITSVGHFVTWQYGGLTLTEVSAGVHHPLPQLRRLMSHRLKGERAERMDIRPGVQYEMRFSLEPADADKFAAYQRGRVQPKPWEDLALHNPRRIRNEQLIVSRAENEPIHGVIQNTPD